MNTSTYRITEALVTIIAVSAVVVGCFFVLLKSIDKNAIADCIVLENQAEHFKPQFYLTKWQDEMCRSYGMIIDAPVQ